jgi:hypothetical protein
MNVYRLLLVLAFISSISNACSQVSPKFKAMDIENKSNDESQILEVTRQLTNLMIEEKTAKMDAIVDKNFTLTHITGYVQSKEEWFSEIESERMKYYSYKEVKTTVNIEGDKATFVGQNILDARIWGSRNAWRLQQTMQLEKRKNKWIILQSVATTF